MVALTICCDFEAQENKILHCFHFPPSICHEMMEPDAMILVFECWVLSQLFHFPLSPSSRGSFVSVHFLPLGWYHLHIWGCWYFSRQSWFQLMIAPAQHLTSWEPHEQYEKANQLYFKLSKKYRREKLWYRKNIWR